MWGGDPSTAKNVRASCVHKGSETRKRQCESCAGKVDIKLLRCRVHGECTSKKIFEDVASCDGCSFYREPVMYTRCDQATNMLSVESMVSLIKAAPPGPWPDGWSGWPNVRNAHIQLLEDEIKAISHVPDFSEGRGIVVCVNAKSGWSSGKDLPHGYLPGAWVLVKELRRLGCQLPVVFAYLGPLEWDPMLTKMVEPLGVTCMDLRQEEQKDPMRILAGWETKVFAILRAPFREVLFIDADNVPVQDPTFLFDSLEYQHHGSIFWPDLRPHDRPEWLPPVVWKNLGMEYRDEVDFESGQLLIDKYKCWKELNVCRFLNEHSDYYYRFIFGDKSTFHLAWAKLRRSYAMPSTAAGWSDRAILQHDFSSRLIFQHACQDKPSLQGYGGRGYLINQDQCDSHLDDLRGRWSGQLWHQALPDKQDRNLTQAMIGKDFSYQRMGFGPPRLMRFWPDERIGVGHDKCEDGWNVFSCQGESILVIRHRDGQVTALLTLCQDGIWRGQWLEHEKCLVEICAAHD